MWWRHPSLFNHQWKIELKILRWRRILLIKNKLILSMIHGTQMVSRKNRKLKVNWFLYGWEMATNNFTEKESKIWCGKLINLIAYKVQQILRKKVFKRAKPQKIIIQEVLQSLQAYLQKRLAKMVEILC